MIIIGVTKTQEAILEDDTTLVIRGEGVLDHKALNINSDKGVFCGHELPGHKKLSDLVRTVRIEPGITEIKDDAFWYYQALRVLDIPDTVKRIGRAFPYSGYRPCTFDLPGGIILSDNAFEDDSKNIFESVSHVHFTKDSGDDRIYFRTYSPEEEESIAKAASEWKYAVKYSKSHSTWYEDVSDSYDRLEDIPPQDYLIEDGELAGIRRLGGSVSAGIHGTRRDVRLENLFFDGRNERKGISYRYHAGNDEFSSGENNDRSLIRVSDIPEKS